MVFSSPVFLFLFLPAVLTLCFVTPRVGRNFVLLATSLVFYAWAEPTFAAVMLASIALNYVFGLLVADTRARHGSVGVTPGRAGSQGCANGSWPGWSA